MQESKHRFIIWVKAHKKQLVLTGVSFTAIVGIVLGFKNKEAVMELWATLEAHLRKCTPNTLSHIPISEEPLSIAGLEPILWDCAQPQRPFGVSQHIRTMADGRHHSAEKAAEALTLGIVLSPNQTLVDSYMKGTAA